MFETLTVLVKARADAEAKVAPLRDAEDRAREAYNAAVKARSDAEMELTAAIQAVVEEVARVQVPNV